MPSRRSPGEYRAQAAQLKSLGFNLHYGNGRKGTTSAAHKSAVSRAWKKVGTYLTNTKQKFKFVPLDRVDESVAKKSGLAKKQFTPGGVLVHVPKGIRSSRYRVQIKKGAIVAKITGPRGGQRREETRPIDPELLADDPKKAILSLVGRKKPHSVILTVNGYDAVHSSGGQGYDWGAFLNYFVKIAPQIMDPNSAQAKKHGADGMTEKQFSDIFAVKMIYQEEPKPKKKTQHGNKRRKNRRR